MRDTRTKPDLIVATELCDRRIATLRQKLATVTGHERWEERHDLLRRIQGYQDTKSVLAEVLS